MGKGGPQPAHQVRPGDLQLEEAGLDLEDPEVFGHLMMPVGQLMCNNEASHMEGSIGELLDDDDDGDDEDDEDDDDVPKDMVDEVIDEHGNDCEGPASIVIYNVNNNAKKSKKSTRKRLSSVLHRMDFLLQEIIYRHRDSKWKSAEEQEPTACNGEFMNKTYNNKYLSSIEEEEDTGSKEHNKDNCQRKEMKSHKADLGIPAGESRYGTVSKRRFISSRRLAPGLWRDTFCDTPRSTNSFQPGIMLGDDMYDFKELRKGMGDVVGDTSELNNLATISDIDKAEVNNDDNGSPGKLSVDRSPHEELDQTTAADFSSYLDPGSDCWNAENASQTTLIDGDTLSSSVSSPKEQKKATTPKEDKVCQLNQEKASPPNPARPRFSDHLNTETSSVYPKDKKHLSDISEEKISEFSNAKENKISAQQDSPSAECKVHDLPDCHVKVKNHASSKPILPSITNLPQPPGAISKNSKLQLTSQKAPKSKITSLVNEYKLEQFPKREQSHTDLINYAEEKVTLNDRNSLSLECSLEKIGSKVNSGQGKSTEISLIKRRKSKMSTSLPQEAVECHEVETNIDATEGTVLKQQRQEFIGILKLDIGNVSETETGKLVGLRSMIAQDGSANDTKSTAVAFQSIAQPISFSVHDNLRPNTFSFHDNDKSYSLHSYDKVKSSNLSVCDSPQQITSSVHVKLNNLLVNNKSRSNKSRARENAKLNTISHPDNAKTDTFSNQCQTSEQNASSTSVQRRINESKASIENGQTATKRVFNFADMDMHRAASDRVLSKLLISKQSQELREGAKSFYYKSKGIQTNTASARRNRISSHQKPPNSVPLPPIRELVTACNDPNSTHLNGDHWNKNTEEPRKTLGMHDNLNKDVSNDTSNKAPYNLTKDVYNWISVYSPAIKKRHTSLENQKGSSPLLHSTRFRSIQNSKVNANLNSTSSYQSSDRPDQDEVTVRISTESQTETNSSITSASSKIPTTSAATSPQKKSGGVLSYFGNRLFSSPSPPKSPKMPNRESSVDGEGYPIRRADNYAVRETASQTLEDDNIWPNSVRKVECHHYHIVSDYEQGMVEEHGTQTEIINPRQETNKLSPSDNVRKRYNEEMPIASISRKKKAVLPKIKEQELWEKHNQAKVYTIDVISPNVKSIRLPQPDSSTESKLTENTSSKLRGKSSKKAAQKQRQQGKQEENSQSYTHENWKPLTSLVDQQRTEFKETVTATRPISDNAQQLSPPCPENVQYATTYRETFQNPEVLKSFHDILDSEPRHENHSLSKLRAKSEEEEARQRKLDNEASKRFVADEHAMWYKLRNQDSKRVSGSTSDKRNKSVSFGGGQVPRLTPLPLPGNPDVSVRLQRCKSVPTSYIYKGLNGDLGKLTNDEVTSQGQDRGTMNYTAPDPPTTLIERSKYTEPQTFPSRMYADSYYDPANNVISVVVKPVNVNVNQKLRNIKVKIYRSPPRLPPITCVPRQQKDRGSKKMHFSAPLSRNILDQRAANPPFNTTTNKEADERFHRMFGHWKIL